MFIIALDPVDVKNAQSNLNFFGFGLNKKVQIYHFWLKKILLLTFSFFPYPWQQLEFL